MTPAAATCEDQITLTQIVRGKKPSDTAAAATTHETGDANNMVGHLWQTSVMGIMVVLIDLFN